jgi:hypothetical protein
MTTINLKKIKALPQKEIKNADNFHSKYYQESDDSDDEKVVCGIIQFLASKQNRSFANSQV